jgi:hypothetical protein
MREGNNGQNFREGKEKTGGTKGKGSTYNKWVDIKLDVKFKLHATFYLCS